MTATVPARVWINGKFTAQRTTGVQRVAEQLVRALDALPPVPGEPRWTLLHPPGGGLEGLARVEQRAVGGGSARLHAWEQWTLWRATRGEGLLLGLAGSAPRLAHGQALFVHDAAVFDHPEAYTRPFAAWYASLFRALARRGERLFTVSSFSQGRLAACLGVPASRVTVVPNGADHLDRVVADEAVLDAHGLRGTRFVLAVGSDNPTKNVATLLQAFARLARPGVRLVVAGGANRRVFARGGAVDGHGEADPPGVLRLGPLADAPLKALYRHAAVLAIPSTYEGFGLPAAEAMREGCPVVAARAAALPEVCGGAAVYADPASPEDIAAALGRVLDDPALDARLRTAGRERAAGMTWAASAERLRAVLIGELASRT